MLPPRVESACGKVSAMSDMVEQGEATGKTEVKQQQATGNRQQARLHVTSEV